MRFRALCQAFIRDEKGATAIEYGLIAALIAVVVIGAVRTIGTNLNHCLHDDWHEPRHEPLSD
jgi:pilus assembly protein Flp/PilA